MTTTGRLRLTTALPTLLVGPKARQALESRKRLGQTAHATTTTAGLPTLVTTDLRCRDLRDGTGSRLPTPTAPTLGLGSLDNNLAMTPTAAATTTAMDANPTRTTGTPTTMGANPTGTPTALRPTMAPTALDPTSAATRPMLTALPTLTALTSLPRATEAYIAKAVLIVPVITEAGEVRVQDIHGIHLIEIDLIFPDRSGIRQELLGHV
jgi:hypothetical protein